MRWGWIWPTHGTQKFLAWRAPYDGIMYMYLHRSQRSPAKPWVHWQKYRCMSLTHLPAFRHGLLKHSSRSETHQSSGLPASFLHNDDGMVMYFIRI